MNNCFLNIVHMTVYAWTKILETKEFLKIIEIAGRLTHERDWFIDVNFPVHARDNSRINLID